MIDPLLLSVVSIETVSTESPRTNATGFFFRRENSLFLVTNRHVVLDEASGHSPRLLEVDLHTDRENLAVKERFQIPLYEGDQPRWRGATDTAGVVDVVAIPCDPADLSPSVVYETFTPDHLVDLNQPVEMGTPLVIVGFPLGFRDSLHHLPVARQAVIASAFGMRFEGKGYFLTDCRLHRGTSGSPVVTRMATNDDNERLPWTLLGIHASRIDLTSRDQTQDEQLGLNCAWYADVLMVITQPVDEACPALPTVV